MNKAEMYAIIGRVCEGKLSQEEGIRELEKLGLHPGYAGQMIFEALGGDDVVEADSQDAIDQMTRE